MKGFACLAALLLNSVIVLAQQFSSVPGQGRSMVVTNFGIVSTPQFLASQAGAHILEQGGNAIDAAIAANAVMGVVQPYVNGIGGDLFMLYYEARTGKVYGLNSSGWTPKALTIDYLKSKGVTEMNPIGVETIDVPGAVAGWDAMRVRFGTLPFKQLLAPAIYYAQNGFPWPSAMPGTGSPKVFWTSPAIKRRSTSGPALRSLVTSSRTQLWPTRFARSASMDAMLSTMVP
jgi:gamma-glutamyltranspeptidase/glutathione hydrolase